MPRCARRLPNIPYGIASRFRSAWLRQRACQEKGEKAGVIPVVGVRMVVFMEAA